MRRTTICANSSNRLSRLFSKTVGGRTYWALDWIGNPAAFSPLGGTCPVDVYVSERQAGSLQDVEDQACMRVNFEELAELRGPWRTQKPPLLTHGFHYELDIDPATVSICALAQSGAAQEALDIQFIDNWPYRLGNAALADAKHSRLLAVSDPLQIDPLFCVIPCMEIVRHFFCTSRHLARHLLTGWEELLVAEGCDAPRASKLVRIQARPGLGTTFDDAATLASYVASAWWRNVTDSVRRQLQHAAVSGTRAAPVCPLPLRAECSLGVEAIAVPAETKLGKRFFVTRIVTSPAPFDLKEAWVQFGPDRGRSPSAPPEQNPWRKQCPQAPRTIKLLARRW